MEKIWLKQYPEGVPAEVKTDLYPSLVALIEESFRKYRDLPAYRFMGRVITFGQVDDASRALAAYLQGLGLARGDRVAIMMPNVPQYPVAVAAILRAGLVVVNVNPLYTPRELEHQLKDSGAEAIIILENFVTTLQEVIDHTPVKHVVIAAMGDALPFLKGTLVNFVVLGWFFSTLYGQIPFRSGWFALWMVLVVVVFYTFFDLLPKMLFRLYPNRLCLMLARPFTVRSRSEDISLCIQMARTGSGPPSRTEGAATTRATFKRLSGTLKGTSPRARRPGQPCPPASGLRSCRLYPLIGPREPGN